MTDIRTTECISVGDANFTEKNDSIKYSFDFHFTHSCEKVDGFAPIFPDICYHLTHYKPAAADIPVASDNPAHYADAIRY
ncbi:hypothetical protein, partial [Escherichia coli]|uniref:hypothetical protein n=1 Tax=Escherichia coli TaxID=562 RepID=UPI001BC8B425